MEAKSALITAIAALIAAIMWPFTILVVILLFKAKVANLLDRINKLKIGAFEIGALDAELEKQAASVTSDSQQGEQISPQQIQAAARVEVQAKSLDAQSLRDKIQQLCFEYETIRNVLPPSYERTRSMTQTFVKMRTLGPAVADWIEDMKASAVAGNRLLAVAIMQIAPDKADVEWLAERFDVEKPFVFFHAANALRIVAMSSLSTRADAAREAAQRALEKIQSFNGPKDADTIRVLTSILESRRA